MSQLKVTSNGVIAKVELDGQDISSGLTGLTVRYDAGDAPKAFLDVIVTHGHSGDVESDDVTVAVPDATAALLVRLGWTPPNSRPLDQQKGTDER